MIIFGSEKEVRDQDRGGDGMPGRLGFGVWDLGFEI